MEPMGTAALAAVITALVNGMAGEVGKSVWASLKSFVLARVEHDSAAASALATIEQVPADQGAAKQLAAAIHDVVRADPAAASWLSSWFEEARAATSAPASVTNIVGGEAQVHGPVIQGHNFFGSIQCSPEQAT